MTQVHVTIFLIISLKSIGIIRIHMLIGPEVDISGVSYISYYSSNL